MELTIIRHGQTTWNVIKKVQGQADPPLTEKGINQAKTLAEKMKSKINLYSAIYSSERIRAYKVAQILKSEFSINLIKDPRLNSRNLGDFSGFTLKEIEMKYPKIYKMWRSQDPNFIPPNGESNEFLLKTTRNFIHFLKNTWNQDDKLLIITHRENIGFLHYALTGKKLLDPLGSIKNCFPYNYIL